MGVILGKERGKVGGEESSHLVAAEGGSKKSTMRLVPKTIQIFFRIEILRLCEEFCDTVLGI